MKQFDILATQIADTAADSIINRSAENASLESHLTTLQDRLKNLVQIHAPAHAIADARLQVARTLVSLERGEEAWPIGRAAFDHFIAHDSFELAADACDVLFQAGKKSHSARSAKGSGWR